MTINRCLILAGCLAISFNAYATDDLMTVSSAACEKISPDESLSSARIRAADVAAFRAVESLPAVASFRDKNDAGSFNTKVYNLTDNHLQNYQMSASQNEAGDVCVEVKAGLSLAQVKKAFAAPIINSMAEPLNSEENNIGLPPKPNITINDDIAYQEPEIVVENPVKQPLPVINNHPATKVLVERTEFFDGTSTDKFYPYLNNNLSQRKDIAVTDIPDNPDYVLKTKVLKAKVDSLNDKTNRLHVVVSLTLTDTKTNQSTTEHQTRFILFENSENAQSTAAGLIRKLFAAGVDKLLPSIKGPASAGNEIITPNR